MEERKRVHKGNKGKKDLLDLAMQLGNITEACKIIGYSRDSYYRFLQLHEKGGEFALSDISRRKANLKNRIDQELEKRVIDYALENPSHGQIKASKELSKKGILISPATLRSVWLRNDLETMSKRILALKTKIAQERITLSESQMQALDLNLEDEKKQEELLTRYPGYLVCLTSIFIGTWKGIGNIFQCTYLDTYSQLVQTIAVNEKSSQLVVVFLNDKVLPFYDEHGLRIQRILTNGSDEYFGTADFEEYQVFLNLKGIESIKSQNSQVSQLSERFHSYLIGEFYQRAIREKNYTSLAELQLDLDRWILSYNRERIQKGKYCFGKTPYQTFLDSLKLAKEK